MDPLCEGCEQAPATAVEPCDDPQEPYSLCAACHRRLLAHALRPLEWFNLAKRHGQQPLLRDDLYDPDGNAKAPREPVEAAGDFPAPRYEAVHNQASALLDYALTRGSVAENVRESVAYLSYSMSKLLVERYRATRKPGVRARLLKIGACAKYYGRELALFAWSDDPQPALLPALAQATAACLDFQDGFPRVTAVLAELEEDRRRELLHSLGYFRLPQILDWIEQSYFEPAVEAWGHLAAASQIDWPRIEQWLERGHPFHRIALDALLAILEPPTPFLQSHRPLLHRPPSSERFREVLETAAETEPPVRQKVATLLAAADFFAKMRPVPLPMITGKGDIKNLDRLIDIGYPGVAPVLPFMIEWLQDMNWPVAHRLERFLVSIGQPVLAEVRRVFATDDEVWKYWCIGLLNGMDLSIVEELRPELTELAFRPTPAEEHEEVAQQARELLQRMDAERQRTGTVAP